MKVRIGNDIRLQVRVSCGEEPVNLLSVQAVIVNRTLEDKVKKEFKKKNRFMHRFPIEPFTNEFQSTAYNINSAGNPQYKVAVPNPYNGLGVNPNWKNNKPFKEMDVTRYFSGVSRTVESDTVVVIFPAAAQMFDGQYDLVLKAQIYDAGYSNNARMITIDYKNVFELVKSSEDSDVDQPVEIHVNSQSDTTPRQDYYVIAGSYDNNQIVLTRNDNAIIPVDVSSISGWYEGD